MKIQSLINKLNKLNVGHEIIDHNGFNQSVNFTINEKTFSATYNVNENIIDSYNRIIGYDHSNQEHDRLFFSNFNKVLRNANN